MHHQHFGNSLMMLVTYSSSIHQSTRRERVSLSSSSVRSGSSSIISSTMCLRNISRPPLDPLQTPSFLDDSQTASSRHFFEIGRRGGALRGKLTVQWERDNSGVAVSVGADDLGQQLRALVPNLVVCTQTNRPFR
eukprot:124356-Pyramimonas_sp.AAC.2